MAQVTGIVGINLGRDTIIEIPNGQSDPTILRPTVDGYQLFGKGVPERTYLINELAGNGKKLLPRWAIYNEQDRPDETVAFIPLANSEWRSAVTERCEDERKEVPQEGLLGRLGMKRTIVVPGREEVVRPATTELVPRMMQNPHTGRSERAVAFCYRLMTVRDDLDRPGGQFSVYVTVPESMAKTLEADILKRPELARELAFKIYQQQCKNYADIDLRRTRSIEAEIEARDGQTITLVDPINDSLKQYDFRQQLTTYR